MFVTELILEEYAATAWALKMEEDLVQNPQPWLNWISSRATILAPVTLAEPVSSDPDDEKFLECALAARADYIVTRDRHLLQLEKPFGITVVDDREFLRRLGRLKPR
jgi:predicted nucleic acid-binding protein